MQLIRHYKPQTRFSGDCDVQRRNLRIFLKGEAPSLLFWTKGYITSRDPEPILKLSTMFVLLSNLSSSTLNPVYLKVFLEAIFHIFPWNFMLCFKKNTCSTSVKLPSVKSHAMYFLKKNFICNKNLKYSRNLTFLWVWSLSCHITFFEKTRAKFILWPWSLATRLLSTFSTKLWQCVKIYTNGNILHCKM